MKTNDLRRKIGYEYFEPPCERPKGRVDEKKRE